MERIDEMDQIEESDTSRLKRKKPSVDFSIIEERNSY